MFIKLKYCSFNNFEILALSVEFLNVYAMFQCLCYSVMAIYLNAYIKIVLGERAEK